MKIEHNGNWIKKAADFLCCNHPASTETKIGQVTTPSPTPHTQQIAKIELWNKLNNFLDAAQETLRNYGPDKEEAVYEIQGQLKTIVDRLFRSFPESPQVTISNEGHLVLFDNLQFSLKLSPNFPELLLGEFVYGREALAVRLFDEIQVGLVMSTLAMAPASEPLNELDLRSHVVINKLQQKLSRSVGEETSNQETSSAKAIEPNPTLYGLSHALLAQHLKTIIDERLGSYEAKYSTAMPSPLGAFELPQASNALTTDAFTRLIKLATAPTPESQKQEERQMQEELRRSTNSPIDQVVARRHTTPSERQPALPEEDDSSECSTPARARSFSHITRTSRIQE